MVAGVRVLKGVNSHIASIFLNVGLARKGEAGTIEDENQERRNIKNMLKGQGQKWLCPSFFAGCDYCNVS
jgi:hypothetical protein